MQSNKVYARKTNGFSGFLVDGDFQATKSHKKFSGIYEDFWENQGLDVDLTETEATEDKATLFENLKNQMEEDRAFIIQSRGVLY